MTVWIESSGTSLTAAPGFQEIAFIFKVNYVSKNAATIVTKDLMKSLWLLKSHLRRKDVMI